MQAINLISLIQAKRDLQRDTFIRYVRQFQLSSKLRDAELRDIATFTNVLQQIGAEVEHFDGFYVGFAIQQISKEFDLLRFGKQYIINIELKYESTAYRIKKQLTQNEYYTRFLYKPVYHFTFVTSTKQLYKYSDGKLQKVPLEQLLELIVKQQMQQVNIEELFDPIYYLVSPLDQPRAFMDNSYFLTAQQSTFKTEILKYNQKLHEWLMIEGGPGTGKTLLTYDCAKTYMHRHAKVCIVHCGELTNGHFVLSQLGWHIYSPDDLPQQKYDVCIIDEAHHLTASNLQQMMQYEAKFRPKIIINYDATFYVDGACDLQHLEEKIQLVRFELKAIIRNNKQIQRFVNVLFDQQYDVKHTNFEHISVHYFSDVVEAKSYLRKMQSMNWQVIDVISDMILQKKTLTKDIFGHEFDRVVALIDEHFFYKENGRLTTKNLTEFYEQPTKILFQALIRTRKKLQLVVVNNEAVLAHILNVLQTRGD